MGTVFSRGGNGPGKPGTTKVKTAAEKKKEEMKKAKKEANIRKEILKKQKQLLKEEINQTWRIAMGNIIPKKKKETFVIENVTRRNIWMEDKYLFNAIKRQFPEEFFHSVEHYVLKWQPPTSRFQIMIPMKDQFLQENAILEIERLTKKQKKKLLFNFTTVDPTMNLYAPKVHPASLVSYRTRTEVLQKLSDLFISGKISVEDIQSILLCNFDAWQSSLYNLLPDDEQVYHKYLIEQIHTPMNEEININDMKNSTAERSLAKKYLDNKITLQEYEDLKFPDRKRQRDIESQCYPLPFIGANCIICGDIGAGVVQCSVCDNMVCKACIEQQFQGDLYKRVADKKSRQSGPRSSTSRVKQRTPTTNTKENSQSHSNEEIQYETRRQSFLLLHHRYCMRLGELPDVIPIVVEESGYLRYFRSVTRTMILDRFNPEKRINYADIYNVEYEDEEEIERKRLEALRLKELEEEERRRKEMENPLELQFKQKTYEERKKKYYKIVKEINEYTEKVLDVASHTEQFIARNKRLRDETVTKLRMQLLPSIFELQRELAAMIIPGELFPELVRTVNYLIEEVEEQLEAFEEEFREKN